MGSYRYYAHYPIGYADDPERRWPLIITLHGAGERHVSLEVLAQHHYYVLTYNLTAERYPAIVVVPHCPPRQYWDRDRLKALVTHLLKVERGDPDRVYLTGFSMGGYGAWLTAGAFPERFAAIAPVCGGGDPRDATRLATLPIWEFHGAKDEVVPVEETLEMVDAIRSAGGNPRVTIYPEGDHGVWDETFANPELYEWFQQHTRRDAHERHQGDGDYFSENAY